MKLVDTDADRPEDDSEPAPIATPPRPEKRRAVASLVFTLAVLGGTVATIYTVFPSPHDHASRVALDHHRRAEKTWALVAPGHPELAAWGLALFGEPPPLPPPQGGLAIDGARVVELGTRQTGLVGFTIDGAPVSYLIARAEHAPDGRSTRTSGELVVETWRRGGFTLVAIGPAAAADRWRPALEVP